MCLWPEQKQPEQRQPLAAVAANTDMNKQVMFFHCCLLLPLQRVCLHSPQANYVKQTKSLAPASEQYGQRYWVVPRNQAAGAASTCAFLRTSCEHEAFHYLLVHQLE